MLKLLWLLPFVFLPAPVVAFEPFQSSLICASALLERHMQGQLHAAVGLGPRIVEWRREGLRLHRPLSRVHVSVIIPVYREWANGNLLQFLEAMVDQEGISPRDFDLTFHVNHRPEVAFSRNDPIREQNFAMFHYLEELSQGKSPAYFGRRAKAVADAVSEKGIRIYVIDGVTNGVQRNMGKIRNIAAKAVLHRTPKGKWIDTAMVMTDADCIPPPHYVAHIRDTMGDRAYSGMLLWDRYYLPIAINLDHMGTHLHWTSDWIFRNFSQAILGTSATTWSPLIVVRGSDLAALGGIPEVEENEDSAMIGLMTGKGKVARTVQVRTEIADRPRIDSFQGKARFSGLASGAQNPLSPKADYAIPSIDSPAEIDPSFSADMALREQLGVLLGGVREEDSKAEVEPIWLLAKLLSKEIPEEELAPFWEEWALQVHALRLQEQYVRSGVMGRDLGELELDEAPGVTRAGFQPVALRREDIEKNRRLLTEWRSSRAFTEPLESTPETLTAFFKQYPDLGLQGESGLNALFFALIRAEEQLLHAADAYPHRFPKTKEFINRYRANLRRPWEKSLELAFAVWKQEGENADITAGPIHALLEQIAQPFSSTQTTDRPWVRFLDRTPEGLDFFFYLLGLSHERRGQFSLPYSGVLMGGLLHAAFLALDTRKHGKRLIELILDFRARHPDLSFDLHLAFTMGLAQFETHGLTDEEVFGKDPSVWVDLHARHVNTTNKIVKIAGRANKRAMLVATIGAGIGLRIERALKRRFVDTGDQAILKLMQGPVLNPESVQLWRNSRAVYANKDLRVVTPSGREVRIPVRLDLSYFDPR